MKPSDADVKKAKKLCDVDPPYLNRCMAKMPCVGCYRCKAIAQALADARADGIRQAAALIGRRIVRRALVGIGPNRTTYALGRIRERILALLDDKKET